MGSYNLSPRAENDLQRIYTFGLERFGERQADIYLSGLIDQFDAIAREPLLYPIDVLDQRYRRCVYQSNVIYFRQAELGISIVAIIGQQDRESWV